MERVNATGRMYLTHTRWRVGAPDGDRLASAPSAATSQPRGAELQRTADALIKRWARGSCLPARR